MSPYQLQRVDQLLDAILDAEDPAAIDLETDPEVAAEARRLWTLHCQAHREGFLDTPVTMVRKLCHAAPLEESEEAPAFAPETILAGRFSIENFLGAGGMGQVYLARDLVLGVRVAIKTIRPALAAQTAIRERFLVEVKASHQVTSRNVCRIYHLFEDGEILFYSMEYLEGATLDQSLRSGVTAEAAKWIAIQLAEGLQVAHSKGIVHRDFKPQNVILVPDAQGLRAVITDFGLARFVSPDANPSAMQQHSMLAGTRKYMAPELLEGRPASSRTDIYAYGKVLAELLPGSEWVARCAADDPGQRPESLAGFLAAMKPQGSGGATRRWLFTGLAALAGAGATYLLLPNGRGPRFPLDSRQRLLINGFQTTADAAMQAFSLRQLVIAGLRQSPLLGPIPDDQLISVLARLGLPKDLPGKLENLFAAARAIKAGIVLDFVLRRDSNTLRMLTRAFRPGDTRAVFELSHSVEDERKIVQLAERISLELRSEFNESEASLRKSYAPLERVTSASPEAVDLYFRAIREYERQESEAALTLLDKAIEIDPQFALAHYHRGLALSTLSRRDAAIESSARAMQLRERVTERERNWIDSQYFSFIGDDARYLAAVQKNAILFPEEAVFQRQTANGYCRLGRFQEAIPFNLRAIELSPFDSNNRSQLVVNLAEGMETGKAIEAYRKSREEGVTSPILEWGLGLAHLVGRNYEESRKAYERLGSVSRHDRWAKLLIIVPLLMQGRWVESAGHLEADLAYDSHDDDSLIYSGYRHYLLATVSQRLGDSVKALEQTRILAELPARPPHVEFIRLGGDLAVELGEVPLAQQCLEKLREIQRRWPSTHISGLVWQLLGRLASAAADSREALRCLQSAVGVWPDGLALFSLSQHHGSHGRREAQLDLLEKTGALRGKLLRNYFCTLAMDCELEQARCYAAMSRFEDALRLYNRLLEEMGRNARDFPWIQALESERKALPHHETRKEKKDND